MATELIKHLRKVFLDGDVPVSPTVAIIGTDKENYSPLLSLYENLSGDIPPNCLSAYLINNKLPWSSLHNLNWLNEAVSTPSLNTFFIAHPAITNALKSASKGTRGIDLISFNKNYKGRQNDSFAEVTILIWAGFKKFEETDIPLEGGGFAGRLTR